MNYSLNALYRAVGVSKQAVHQWLKREHEFNQKWQSLIVGIESIRAKHPGCGLEKMYHLLLPDFVGRDCFIEGCMALGYGLKRKKNYRRTTRSSKSYYPNLIKGMKVDRPGIIWQSDITYLPLNGQHSYATFIIDVFSKKIVGYSVAENMLATLNVKALTMALRDNLPPLYHHSDRGGQYNSKVYTNLLKQNRIKISMGKTAQDNAYAERIHRTIKEEYLQYWCAKNTKQLKQHVKLAVRNYNQSRLHNNIERQTPIQFEKNYRQKQINKTITIFDNHVE